ncbi:TSC22 domain family protein 1 isoform X1 [Genypterus blacodes]|uniref:TSC22 domain family protein 1 isoform X1 n=1 Tax=Genypterus blacodes TaxID=154954 RepID=UPI003F75AB51
MHHQDFSGDPPGTGSRKTAFHSRRGSGASAAAAAGEDNPTQARASSPALHLHQPPSQVAAAQVKKKSGFQITSVTSAQISVSGNNSLADDTESYDDMDESHTEDLSSSDMLDVSVSKATDTGVTERSSSDETLNSLHGVDTPGLVSPNEPLHPLSIAQQHTAMVNGTVPHHHYTQQHSQPHHHYGHHAENFGGAETSTPALPVAPLASSSPAIATKTGLNQAQRSPMLDNTKPAVGGTQPLATVGGSAAEVQLQGSVNTSNVSAVNAAVLPPSGPVGLDGTVASGQVASVGVGANSSPAPGTQSQHTQTQTVTGSRFRVVKLDTNTEPIRKGRWTCTEYYEKEVPHSTTSEAPKGSEVAAETETGHTGVSPGHPAVQPPHTLQPYQPPSQDFTSPQAMQSPPQGLALNNPMSYVCHQEVVCGGHIQRQPPPVMVQQLPYNVDPHLAQGGYPTPQLHTGVMAQGGVRQPDFIQPTAPFQTQVQHPLPHTATGLSMTVGPGGTAQPHQGQQAPSAQFAAGQTQTLPALPRQQQHLRAQPGSTAPGVPIHATPYMTALQADLQPLLTPGTTLAHTSAGANFLRNSQLEDAQRLLLQHQGLFGVSTCPGGILGSGCAGSLVHMGMAVEASAFMAAAGLRTHHCEGEDDSSSGANVVAIDNKIEQAMDLVKSHLMYAVREEVEVLKEQIKELIDRNNQLEQENSLLKNLASPEQMAQFQAQVQTVGSPTGTAQPLVLGSTGTTQILPSTQNSV